mgnify:CR=1 FL=1
MMGGPGMGAPGMGGLTPERDMLYQVAVACAAQDELGVGVGCGRMDHHRHVHVVQGTSLNELRLASQKLDPALPPQLIPVLDIDVLLGWDGYERDPPRQVLDDAGVL